MKMQKHKLLKRSVPLWALLLSCAILVSAVIAAVMFTTPVVTQSMKLAASYNLELYMASEKNTLNPTSWILVSAPTTMDWGMFSESEEQFWCLKVKNVGNVAGNVAWHKSGWTEENGLWTLTVDMAGTQTAEGVTKPLALGAEVAIKLSLKENTATAGTVYSFGVYIENSDIP